MCGCVRAYAHVCVCVCSYRFSWWISTGIGSRRQSFGDLAFWSFNSRSVLPRRAPVYLLPVPRGHGRPFGTPGLATLRHTEGTSAERWISTVTAGTGSWQRAFGLRMQTAGLLHLTGGKKREDGERKETERDWLDVTRLRRQRTKAVPSLPDSRVCRWWEWIPLGRASRRRR